MGIEVASELRDSMNALADSLHGLTEKTLQRHVKVAQQELKASVRNFVAACQAAKTACDARFKTNALHRKAAKTVSQVTASCKEARAREATANEEHDRVLNELEACRVKLSSLDEQSNEAKSKIASAEEQAIGYKRKRDECKTVLGEVKQSLKMARNAEKDANSGRDAVYKDCAKTDSSAKKELKAVKAQAQAAAQEQQKAF